MYTIHVEGRIFEIAIADGGVVVNGQPVNCDLMEVQDGYFHVRLNNKGFRVEIVEADAAAKQLTIKVNGRNYPVRVKDKFDALLEKMGMNTNSGSRMSHIRAPMPGLIIALKVKDGDVVKAGDTILILEAMKMENIIKAPGDAVVKSVKVNMGDGVEKNQVLVEFSPA